MIHLRRVVLILTLCAGFGSVAAGGEPSRLTVDRIFASEEFKEEEFSAKWLGDGSGYTTLEPSKTSSSGRDVVRYDPRTGKREVLVPAAHLIPPDETAPLKIEGYQWSKNRAFLLVYTNSKRVWRRNTRGDYWVLDRTSRELHKLGGDAPASTLMFAKFSPDGSRVAYVRENNIYLEDLGGRQITPLTTTGSEEVINGTFDWVYEEELGLRDGFRFSPDGKSIAYWQLNTQGVGEFPLVDYTGSIYPRTTTLKYPKVGRRNSLCRLGVADVNTGSTRWLDIPRDPRNHYLARMAWAGNSSEIILQQLNRLQNVNRVMMADAGDGSVKEIHVERDDAWLDVHDELMWLAGGKQFTWISERDGWRRVCLHDRQGGKPRPITPNDYDVVRLLHVDEEGGWIYYIASPHNPTQRYLYRGKLDGTGHRRLTPADQSGTHEYDISPDGRFAIHTCSTFDKPPRTGLVRLKDHHSLRPLAANKRLHAKVGKLKQRPGEFFRVDIGSEVKLDGWCVKPPDFDSGKKYPLLVYVYGEPAGQTVLDRWRGKNHLWHLMLAQRGYVVMSFDNRGAPAPRGREWRKCVYKKIGVLAPKDQAAAVRAVLKGRKYLDAKRVGVWGWSGGGSMSLHAIFKYPELYQTAVSVAPVSNERFYDTIYQERYMGLPADNVEGYHQGSAINFAQRLRGNLLVIHGTADDNVHHQSTLALADELIRHNKHFSMMLYPNRTHSIREGDNTSRHLRTLMTRYLLENLPPDGG